VSFRQACVTKVGRPISGRNRSPGRGEPRSCRCSGGGRSRIC
jgi:hypothetical protein